MNSETVSPTSIHGFSVELTQVSYILPGIAFSTVDVFVLEWFSNEVLHGMSSHKVPPRELASSLQNEIFMEIPKTLPFH